jgi:hypothetical protein
VGIFLLLIGLSTEKIHGITKFLKNPGSRVRKKNFPSLSGSFAETTWLNRIPGILWHENLTNGMMSVHPPP